MSDLCPRRVRSLHFGWSVWQSVAESFDGLVVTWGVTQIGEMTGVSKIS